MKPSQKKPGAPQEAGDVGAEAPGSAEQEKSRVCRILRELSLLKLLKRTNRRIARLHALAVRCWRAVTAPKPPCLQPATAGDGTAPPEPEEPQEHAAGSPVGDADRGADVVMEPAHHEDEWGLLEALPQRVHVPAPKVLCRPSAQRWVKPCCTRSCSDSLEHALALRYPQ